MDKEERERLHQEVLRDQLEADMAATIAMVKRSKPMLAWAYKALDSFIDLFEEISSIEGIDEEDPKSVAWAMETMDSLLSMHTKENPLANMDKFDPSHVESMRRALENIVANVINILRSVTDHDQFMGALMAVVPPGILVHDSVREIVRRQAGGME